MKKCATTDAPREGWWLRAVEKGKIACYTSRCGGCLLFIGKWFAKGIPRRADACQFNNISKRDFRSEHKDSFRVEAENA